MQSSFMNDLNSRLKLGPKAPPAKEPESEAEEEKAPLVDAHKSRAKGPARRKPAGAAVDATPFALAISPCITIWQIGEEEELTVPSSTDLEAAEPAAPAAEKALAANIESNVTEAAPATTSEDEMAPVDSDVAAEKADDIPGAFPTQPQIPQQEQIGAHGDMSAPSVVSENDGAQQ